MFILAFPLSWRKIMFGFQGGESAETVARKKGYMKDAQEKWHFLTSFDLSTIKNKRQLHAMVKTRASLSDKQATKDVEAWVQASSSDKRTGF